MKKALFKNGVVVADGLQVVNFNGTQYGLLSKAKDGVARAVEIGDKVAEITIGEEMKGIDKEFDSKICVESYDVFFSEDGSVDDVDFVGKWVEVKESV